MPRPEQIWPDVLSALVQRRDLDPAQVEAAMGAILSGEATDAQIAGFAVGLRAKGETPVELAGMVRTMLRFSERVEIDLAAAAHPVELGGVPEVVPAVEPIVERRLR